MKIGSSFRFTKNNLVVCNVDIQSVEPLDQRYASILVVSVFSFPCLFVGSTLHFPIFCLGSCLLPLSLSLFLSPCAGLVIHCSSLFSSPLTSPRISNSAPHDNKQMKSISKLSQQSSSRKSSIPHWQNNSGMLSRRMSRSQRGT